MPYILYMKLPYLANIRFHRGEAALQRMAESQGEYKKGTSEMIQGNLGGHIPQLLFAWGL